jgi:hypothetical protein
MSLITSNNDHLQDELLNVATERDRALNQLADAKDLIRGMLKQLDRGVDQHLLAAGIRSALSVLETLPNPSELDDDLENQLAELRGEYGHLVVIIEELRAKESRIADEIDELETRIAEREDELELELEHEEDADV